MEVDWKTIETLLLIASGGLVVPVIEMLKKTVIVNWVKPEFLKFILMAFVAGMAVKVLYPEAPMDYNQIITYALAGTGAGALWYKTTRKAIKKGTSQ